MINVIAVIGAGYGDEGKGLLTDFHARRQPGAVVIRHNGGAQAGHTVTTGAVRHVFSHFGSGTLAGTPTYLSRFFVSNPSLFVAEWAQLESLGVMPEVLADPDGLVTTVFDMALNRLREIRRGAGRHGSCGVGFGEAIGRSEAGWSLRIRDIGAPDFIERIKAIRDSYARVEAGPQRSNGEDALYRILTSDRALEAYVVEALTMRDRMRLMGDADLVDFPTLIFEGAQGLMLDQDYGVFPHVTRSHTGLRNAMAVLAGLKTKPNRFEVYYATRAYTTRHGAGPLPGETKLPYAVVDATNVPNPYQGTLRFAPLDFDILDAAITHDLRFAETAGFTGGTLSVRRIATCLDQIREEACYVEGGIRKDLDGRTFTALLKERFDGWSQGPSAQDVVLKQDRKVFTGSFRPKAPSGPHRVPRRRPRPACA